MFGSSSVEPHRGFFIGTGAVDGEHGALAELLVQHTEAFLQEVGIGGLERLARSACRGCARNGTDPSEAVLFGIGDRSAGLWLAAISASAGSVIASAGTKTSRLSAPVTTLFVK